MVTSWQRKHSPSRQTVSSCSHFATEEKFCEMLRSAARDAGVQLRQIEARQQSCDHPILWGVEESSYLKFYLFQVI